MSAASEQASVGNSRIRDVVIVGGGMAGTVAAVQLGRRGIDTVMIDLHDTFPQDFRADKLAGDQLPLMRRLGIFDAIAAKSARLDSVLNTRNGRVIDRQTVEEYSLPYEDMVNAVRPLIPDTVDRIVGRVADIEAGRNSTLVTLASGETIECRLAVMATGGGETLKRKLGISRRTLRASHSVSIGFDLEPVGREAFEHKGLACYGNGDGDLVDYISVFPFQRAMRVNLFVYREPRDAWLKAFKARPAKTLFETLPGFEAFLGDFKVVGGLHMRPVDLYESVNYKRAGAVLVGDAFRSGCPSVGMGLSRVFTDVDRLCNTYIPHWLATPGMEASKISEFYDDPEKKACDAEASRKAEYRRSVTTDMGLPWKIHRKRVFLQRRLKSLLGAMKKADVRHREAA